MLDITGLVLMVVSLIANSIGTAIPYWLYYKRVVAKTGETGRIYYGLWKMCIDASSLDGPRCVDIAIENGLLQYMSEVAKEFIIARAIEISAHIPIFAAIVIVSFKILTKDEGTKSFNIAAALAFISGVLSIAGAVTFVTAGFVKDIDHVFNATAKPHAGFALCIVSGGLSFIATVVFILHKASCMQSKSTNVSRVTPMGETNKHYNDSRVGPASNRQSIVIEYRTKEWREPISENEFASARAWPVATYVPQKTTQRNENLYPWIRREDFD